MANPVLLPPARRKLTIVQCPHCARWLPVTRTRPPRLWLHSTVAMGLTRCPQSCQPVPAGGA